MEHSVKRLLFVSFVLIIGIGLFAQSVDSKGNLNYGFSIDLPAGRLGIQPNIELYYNSAHRDGILGAGWQLNGIPKIERDNTYPEQFTTYDKYSFNGQRLKKINYGANWAEFRTEIDSYSVFKLYNENTASSYWEMKDQNGRTYYFGLTTSDHSPDGLEDGRLLAFGHGDRAVEWSLSRVEDLHGNYFYIKYLEEVDRSAAYPLEIVYTLNDLNPSLHTFKVQFIYETYHQNHMYFYDTSKKRIFKRLKQIALFRNNSKYFQYDLGYEISTFTNRAMLTSLSAVELTDQESGDIGDSVLYKESFEYTDLSGARLVTIGWTEVGYWEQPSRQDFFFTDYTGDGRDDIVKVFTNENHKLQIEPYISNGFTFTKASTFNTNIYYEDPWSYVNLIGQGYTRKLLQRPEFFFADYNGDNRSDLLVFTHHSSTDTAALYRVKSNGVSFESVPGYHRIGPWNGTRLEPDHWQSPTDIDGDGRQDVIQIYAGTSGSVGYNQILSNGNSFSVRSFKSLYSSTNVNDRKYMIADSTGDGKPDILTMTDNGDYTGLDPKNSNGESHTNGTYIYPWSTSRDYEHRYLTLDVNGDGHQDVLDIFGISPSTNVATNPTSFKLALADDVGFGKIAGTHGTLDAIKWSSANSYHTGDVNGDGLDDLICAFFPSFNYASPNQRQDLHIKVYFSNGSTFYDSAMINTRMLADIDPFLYQSLVGDSNGDGQVEIILIKPEVPPVGNLSRKRAWAKIVALNNRTQPDLLIDIERSNGSSHKISYYNSLNEAGETTPYYSTYPFRTNVAPKQLVQTITINDGMEDIEKYFYTYGPTRILQCGRRDTADLGFTYIERRFQEKETYGSWASAERTITYYHQDTDLTSARLRAGEVSRIEKYANYTTSRDEIVSTTDFEYILKNSSFATAVKKYYLSKTTTQTVPGIQNIVEYGEPNEFGQIETVSYINDPNQTLDDVVKRYQYRKTSEGVVVPEKETVESYNLDGVLQVAYETRKSYDEKGQLLHQEFENGLKDSAIQYSYDSYGLLSTMKDSRLLAGEDFSSFIGYTGYTQKIEYDLDFHQFPVKTVDVLGNVEQIEYSLENHVVPIKTIDINGQEFSTVLDQFGNPIETYSALDLGTPGLKITYSHKSSAVNFPSWTKTETKDSAPGDPATYFETYEYFDGLGRTIQTKVESDVYGEWITQDFYYDYAGRNWKTSVKYITYTSDFTTRDTAKPNTYNEYDALGRVVRSYNPDSTFKQMVYDLNTTWTIDENGHAVSVTIEGNKTITKQYTGTAVVNGTMVSGVTEYAVTETITAADGTRIIDHDGNVIETEIDMLGRTIRYSDPDKGEYFYSYDANGNLISQTDGKGEVLTFTYDPLNRLVDKRDEDPTSPIIATYSYGTDPAKNEVGRLVSVTTRDLGTDTYTYDELGRLDIYSRTLLGVSASIDYDYDYLGRVVQYTLPNGEVVTNEYGSGGNVSSINGTNTLEGYENYSYVLDAQYLASGQMQGFELGNGVQTSYDYYDTSSEYDPYTGLSYSHRLRNIFIQASDGTILADTTYQYDYLDNIMVKAYSGSFGNSSYTELYQYDDLNRLISWTSNVLDPETDVTKTWAYDEINNMISNNGTLYTYDPNRPHAVNNAGGVTYQYDANGNMISKDGYRTLEYNSEERLVSMSDGGTYIYDVTGQRAVKDEGGITTYYFFPEFEWHTDGAVSGYISYVFMNGDRIAKREQKGAGESDLYYFHKDHLDSSVGMTDDAGLIVFAAAYAPFGQEIFSAGTIIPKFTFTDQEIEANGIMYYNARYYDPALSRFLQADPVLDGLNRYAYVGNNPVKYIDPSGNNLTEFETHIIAGERGEISGDPTNKSKTHSYSGQEHERLRKRLQEEIDFYNSLIGMNFNDLVEDPYFRRRYIDDFFTESNTGNQDFEWDVQLLLWANDLFIDFDDFNGIISIGSGWGVSLIGSYTGEEGEFFQFENGIITGWGVATTNSWGAETNVAIFGHSTVSFLPDMIVSEFEGKSGTTALGGSISLVGAVASYEVADKKIGYSISFTGGFSVLPIDLSGYVNSTRIIDFYR
jgi:RHS repeat-associated protein